MLFLALSTFSQSDTFNEKFYKNVSFLELKEDSLSINEIITIYEKNELFKPMDNSIYYEFKDNDAAWFHFKLDSITNTQIFTIWNNYLDYSKVYIKKAYGKLIEKREYSLLEKGKFNNNTRKPYWEFTAEESNSDVFIKIKDYDLKTNLRFYLLSTERHNSMLVKENALLFLQLSFLIFLFIFVFIIYLAKKQLSLLWYSIYILLWVMLYFINSGLHMQLNILDIPIFQPVSQVFFANTSMLFACLFLINFYKFDKETFWVKKVFTYISYYFAFVFFVFLCLFVFNITLISKESIIYFSRGVLIIIALLQIYLAVKKTIPYYLAFGFNLPIIGFFIFVNDAPTFSTSFKKIIFIENLIYITTSLEIFIVIFFIVKSLLNSEILAVKLNKENLTLRNSFKDAIIEAHEIEKRELFTSVSDSLGGYIQALKNKLNPNNEYEYEAKDLLENLDSEYQTLVNSLYSPKITSNNLTDHLTDFINKQNGVVNYIIEYNFSIENTLLSYEKSTHLYRIIVELITNAIEHSGASSITVNLSENENKDITVLVSDNGIGFSINDISSNSIGIKRVKKRVRSMNGKIDIKSEKFTGTTITIEVPKN